jgi:ABC-2 type transport system permease protein
MSLRRAAAIVRKEFLHIARDPRNLFLVMASPAFLLFLLAYVFSFDVGKLSLAVSDLERSSLSRRYLASLTSNQDLALDFFLNSYEEAFSLLVSGDVDAVLMIPRGFADMIYGGEAAPVQVVVDGADPFAGNAAIGALEARSEVFVGGVGPGGLIHSRPAVEVLTRVWYNAGQESLLSMVPGLMAIVFIMPTMALALALTRDKETGTLEGLIVTPISGPEYLAGKLLAYIGAGLLSAVFALLVAVVWFKVPLRGSAMVFLLLSAVYFFACMGVAVVIASFIKSQQTAMFVVMLVFLVPSFFLAGLITPIGAGAPGSLLTSYALPSTHFVEISRAVFLKGLGLNDLLRPTLVLLSMGTGTVVIGLRLFRKKVA